MREQENVRIVQEMFHAFGRGDAAALISMLSEDVVWYIAGPAELIPYAGERRGHEGVMQFLAGIGGSVEFERFEPREFVAQNDKVVALGFERGRVKANGRMFDNPWALVFTVRDGKVSEFRSYEDSAAVAAAFRGD
jgi:ketosteroid isomerase-like protein